MRARTRFGDFDTAAGGYESYYMRAVDPSGPRSVWLRHTIHQAPGGEPHGSIWLTLFDGSADDGPVPFKQTHADPRAPDDAYLRIGASTFAPGFIRGEAGEAEWDLTYTDAGPPLHHLPRAWMYTAKLPRTKLESPDPAALFSGTVRSGGRAFELDRWPGMIGHNWGAQHAERWIWLHGTAFDDLPEAWVDIAFGRIKLRRLTTPWIANGMVGIGGERTRVGGPRHIRSTTVREDPLRLDFELAAEGAKLEGSVHSPRAHTVVWRYADPDGEEHNVANCSIASLDLVLTRQGGVPLRLHTAHGGAYELGMRETDHGLPVQPYPDP